MEIPYRSSLTVKLNRANALLFKIRNLINNSILRTIHFSIFESHLNYCSLVWSQNFNASNWLVVLQKEALRIINFQPCNSHSSPLFKKNPILEFSDKVNLGNTFLSVNPSIILYPLFSITGSYFHLITGLFRRGVRSHVHAPTHASTHAQKCLDVW